MDMFGVPEEVADAEAALHVDDFQDALWETRIDAAIDGTCCNGRGCDECWTEGADRG